MIHALRYSRSVASPLRCLLLALFGLISIGFTPSVAELNWQPGAGCRWSELAVSKNGRSGFRLLNSSDTGILFTNFLADDHSLTNRNLLSGSGVAAGDVDGDGLVDLYFCGLDDERRSKFQSQIGNGRPVTTEVIDKSASLPEYTDRFFVTPSGEVLELGEPDVLYLNDGKGRFRALAFTDGSFLDEEGLPLSDPPRDWGLAVQFHDIDGNGAPDIYVCNDLFTPDRIWLNDGKGIFRALPRTALRNTSTFCMGVDFADVDRD